MTDIASWVLNKRVKISKEDQNAFDQWIKDGTVSEDYLRRVLGDSPESVVAFQPSPLDQSKASKEAGLE